MAGILRRLRERAGALKETLARERGALGARDPDAAALAAQDKRRLVDELEALAAEIKSRSPHSVDHPSGAVLDALPGDSAARTRDAVWAECRAILTQCRMQNSVNGRIIEIYERNTRRMLEILSGAAGHGQALYDPSGEVHRVHASRYATRV